MRTRYALILLAACGSDVPRIDPHYGPVPEAGVYNPPPATGGEYGYGNPPPGEDAGVDAPPPGPPPCPESLKRCAYEFRYPAGGESTVELRGDFEGASTWQTGIPMTKAGGAWTASVPLPLGKKVLYKYCIDGCKGSDGWKVDPSQPTEKDASGNTNNVLLESPKACDSPTCAKAPGPIPGVFDWRDAVLYFVFVDRFRDGNPSNNCGPVGATAAIADFYGGDYAGLLDKINEGYFNDLGVNTLWLTAPMQNAKGPEWGAEDGKKYAGYHGYWPKELDPATPYDCFGTKAELQSVVDAAHAKGLRVLFDYAMVHVHSESSIYQAHKDWFWSDNGNPGPICKGDQWNVWNGNTWNPDGPGTKCWFTNYLPHWNFKVKEARDYSVANAIAWATTYGVDGLRLDAIKHIDISWLTQLRSQVASTIMPTKKQGERFYLIGETYDFSRERLKYHVNPDTMLDGQFDFVTQSDVAKALLLRRLKMSDLSNSIAQSEDYYGPTAVMSPFVGNHDMARAIHWAEDSPPWDEWGNGSPSAKERAWSNEPVAPSSAAPYERLANAFAAVFTMRGAPLLYYGDEYGLAGAGDPDNRRAMPWSGHSAHQTALFARVKKLLSIRASHLSLRYGTRTTLEATDDLWLFSMSTVGDTLYVAINRSDRELVTTKLPSGNYSELLVGGTVSASQLTVPARQTRILSPN